MGILTAYFSPPSPYIHPHLCFGMTFRSDFIDVTVALPVQHSSMYPRVDNQTCLTLSLLVSLFMQVISAGITATNIQRVMPLVHAANSYFLNRTGSCTHNWFNIMVPVSC